MAKILACGTIRNSHVGDYTEAFLEALGSGLHTGCLGPGVIRRDPEAWHYSGTLHAHLFYRRRPPDRCSYAVCCHLVIPVREVGHMAHATNGDDMDVEKLALEDTAAMDTENKVPIRDPK